MTLYELSVDYYNTCAGLTRRIESLRKNRCPGDKESDEKLKHYLQVRGELRAQARLLEHYYDRGYVRGTTRCTSQAAAYDR